MPLPAPVTTWGIFSIRKGPILPGEEFQHNGGMVEVIAHGGPRRLRSPDRMASKTIVEHYLGHERVILGLHDDQPLEEARAFLSEWPS
ncbi:hypothetical protein [Mesorhizobium sp. 113-3-3]|uniref:hypothetical protein n=1 Tax=Mesorhizobium sp. 113-3-3 TaxID=2744516 RepID=UPI0018EBEAC9|nr:hypothetical protein [Mesorhizobium sp. 113-3-3]BCG83299.1 hypothetical protein MesoLj113b_68410 [Mesorhizobium sp. 113-3-3]